MTLSASGEQLFLVAKSGRPITLMIDKIDGKLKGYEFMCCLLRVIKEHGYRTMIDLGPNETQMEIRARDLTLSTKDVCLLPTTITLFLELSDRGLIGELFKQKVQQ